MFSGASNLKCLKATYLKFAIYVDILEHIIFAKLKNDRTKDNEFTRCTKMEFLFPRKISTVCISCPNCHHLLSGILAILLVQKASSCHTFRIIQR